MSLPPVPPVVVVLNGDVVDLVLSEVDFVLPLAPGVARWQGLALYLEAERTLALVRLSATRGRIAQEILIAEARPPSDDKLSLLIDADERLTTLHHALATATLHHALAKANALLLRDLLFPRDVRTTP